MLVIKVDRRGDTIYIGDDVVMHVAMEDNKVKLSFDAPKEIEIDREKVRKQKQGEA